MASAVTIKATEIPEVRALVEAVQTLIVARAAGADGYELTSEIDALEIALAKLTGVYDKVCASCGKPFEPDHRHLDSINLWMEPGAYIRCGTKNHG